MEKVLEGRLVDVLQRTKYYNPGKWKTNGMMKKGISRTVISRNKKGTQSGKEEGK